MGDLWLLALDWPPHLLINFSLLSLKRSTVSTTSRYLQGTAQVSSVRAVDESIHWYGAMGMEAAETGCIDQGLCHTHRMYPSARPSMLPFDWTVSGPIALLYNLM